jgi:hypothetical protein
MAAANDFYRIVTMENRIVALDSEDTTILYFASNDPLVLDQIGITLISISQNGLYSFYLPNKWYEDPTNPLDSYIDPETPVTCFLSGATGYEEYNGILIIHKDDYYVFINPNIYSLSIADNDVADRRERILERLYAKEIQVRENLSYSNGIVVTADGTDYLIKHTGYLDSCEKPQETIVRLGKAKQLHKNSLYLMATDAEGKEYIYGAKPGVEYEEVISFTDEENEEVCKIMSSTGIHGYYFVDEVSDILAIGFFFEKRASAYYLKFDEPVKEIRLKKYTVLNDNLSISLWSGVFGDEPDEQLLVVTPKGRILTKLEELI